MAEVDAVISERAAPVSAVPVASSAEFVDSTKAATAASRAAFSAASLSASNRASRSCAALSKSYTARRGSEKHAGSIVAIVYRTQPRSGSAELTIIEVGTPGASVFALSSERGIATIVDALGRVVGLLILARRHATKPTYAARGETLRASRLLMTTVRGCAAPLGEEEWGPLCWRKEV